MSVGETVQNTLKGSGTENRGGKTKILKRGGGKLSQEVGALKKGRGRESPYELWATTLSLLLKLPPAKLEP